MAFSESRRPEFEKRAAELVSAAYSAAFMSAMERLPQHGKKAVELLERFAALYGETPLEGSMIDPGMELWREYWQWTGKHMIRTDEGWEEGTVKPELVKLAKDEGEPLDSYILEEINAPAA